MIAFLLPNGEIKYLVFLFEVYHEEGQKELERISNQDFCSVLSVRFCCCISKKKKVIAKLLHTMKGSKEIDRDTKRKSSLQANKAEPNTKINSKSTLTMHFERFTFTSEIASALRLVYISTSAREML